MTGYWGFVGFFIALRFWACDIGYYLIFYGAISLEAIFVGYTLVDVLAIFEVLVFIGFYNDDLFYVVGTNFFEAAARLSF